MGLSEFNLRSPPSTSESHRLSSTPWIKSSRSSVTFATSFAGVVGSLRKHVGCGCSSQSCAWLLLDGLLECREGSYLVMPRWDLLVQLECTSGALNPRKTMDRTDGLTNAYDREHACYLVSTLKTLQSSQKIFLSRNRRKRTSLEKTLLNRHF